jgi:predicted small lipoprotein YifL
MSCRRLSSPLAAALAGIGAALFLAGCGMKGDLYLPEDPPAEGTGDITDKGERRRAPLPPPREQSR